MAIWYHFCLIDPICLICNCPICLCNPARCQLSANILVRPKKQWEDEYRIDQGVPLRISDTSISGQMGSISTIIPEIHNDHLFFIFKGPTMIASCNDILICRTCIKFPLGKRRKWSCFAAGNLGWDRLIFRGKCELRIGLHQWIKEKDK